MEHGGRRKDEGGRRKEEGKEDATILALIESADYKTLQSLHKQYDKATEGEFNFTCTDCGSHNVTRASADPNQEGEEAINKDAQEVIDGFTGVGKVKLPSWMKDSQSK